jgi:hypothetical protein
VAPIFHYNTPEITVVAKRRWLVGRNDGDGMHKATTLEGVFVSIGEIGDELRRLIKGLPVAEGQGALDYLDQAIATFTAVTYGSQQGEVEAALAYFAEGREQLVAAGQTLVLLRGTIERFIENIGATGGGAASPAATALNTARPIIDGRGGGAGGQARVRSTRSDDATARFTEARAKLPRPVPAGWRPRVTNNGKGVAFQRPGAEGDADMIRVMDPTERYGEGYVVFHNAHGQPMTPAGKPGTRAETHIPIGHDGPWPLLDGK